MIDEILLETEEFGSGQYDTGLVEATQAEQKRLAKLAKQAQRSA